MAAYGWFVTLNGVLYVIICSLTVPLHILVAISIIKTGVVKKRITLRILLSLAFVDILQLLIQGIAGFSICIRITLNDTFNNVMGFMMNGLWAVTVIQHVTLALDRLKVVWSRKLITEEEFKYFDASIVASYLFGIAKACFYDVGKFNNLYFDAPNLNWTKRGEGTSLSIRLWFWFRLFALAVGIVASIIVVIFLISHRRSTSGRKQLLTKQDFRVFIQTTIVFILAITHIGTWNLVGKPADLYLLGVLNMEWVLVCALLPYLNLVMSSDIRNSFFRLLGMSKQKSNAPHQTDRRVTIFSVTPSKKSATN